ncbi:hypothetical protein ACTFIZ_004007 [Dictyostelium cf. discoideum]
MGNTFTYFQKESENNLSTFKIPKVPTFEEISKKLSKDGVTKKKLEEIFEECCFMSIDFFFDKYKSSDLLKCLHQNQKVEWMFKCKQCSNDASGYICCKCFLNGNHIEEGHTFSLYESQINDFCDCGNEEILKKSGFCSTHAGVNEKSKKEVIDRLPFFIKKDVHIFFRYLFQYLQNLTTSILLEKNSASVEVIIGWLKGICSVSSILVHIIAEEFTSRQLEIGEDSKSRFKLNEHKPLPYKNEEESIQRLWESHHFLGYIFSKVAILDKFLPLLSLLIDNHSTFKVSVFEEYLKNFITIFTPRDRASSRIMQFLGIVYIENIKISLPFSTGYSRHNVIELILRSHKTIYVPLLLPFYQTSSSKDITKEVMLQTDVPAIPKLLKEPSVLRYFCSQSDKFKLLFEYARELHKFTSLQFVDPSISTTKFLLVQELNLIASVKNIVVTLDEMGDSKFHQEIIDSIAEKLVSAIGEIKKRPVFERCGIKLPHKDFFQKFTYAEIPVHFPLYRMLSTFLLMTKMDPSLLYTKYGLVEVDVIDMVHTIVLFRIFYITYDPTETLENCTDITMTNDLHILQVAVCLLGSKKFLYSFFNVVSSIEPTPSAFNEAFSILVSSLQIRATLVPTKKVIEFHLLQGLFSNIFFKTHFRSFDSVLMGINEHDICETYINGLAEPTGRALELKDQDNWKYYDPYYPHFSLTYRNAIQNGSKKRFKKYMESKKIPSESNPLPPILDDLPTELLGLTKIFNDQTLIEIIFCILADCLYPTFIGYDNSIELQPILKMIISNPQIILNDFFYLLVLSIKSFKEITLPILTKSEIDEIVNSVINFFDHEKLIKTQILINNSTDQNEKENLLIENQDKILDNLTDNKDETTTTTSIKEKENINGKEIDSLKEEEEKEEKEEKNTDKVKFEKVVKENEEIVVEEKEKQKLKEFGFNGKDNVIYNLLRVYNVEVNIGVKERLSVLDLLFKFWDLMTNQTQYLQLRASLLYIFSFLKEFDPIFQKVFDEHKVDLVHDVEHSNQDDLAHKKSMAEKRLKLLEQMKKQQQSFFDDLSDQEEEEEEEGEGKGKDNEKVDKKDDEKVDKKDDKNDDKKENENNENKDNENKDNENEDSENEKELNYKSNIDDGRNETTTTTTTTKVKIIEESEEVENIIKIEKVEEKEKHKHEHKHDHENEDEDEHSEFEPCVVCKLSEKAGRLFAIAYVDLSSVSHQNTKQSIDEIKMDKLNVGYNENYKKFLEKYYSILKQNSVKTIPTGEKPDSFSIYLFSRSVSTYVTSCGHNIHKRCFDNLIKGQPLDPYLTTAFKCPLCNRHSNITIVLGEPNETIQYRSYVEDLFKKLCYYDFVSLMNKDSMFSIDEYLWKFIIQNIETLELKSRKTTLYNDNDQQPAYFLMSEHDFQRELTTTARLHRVIAQVDFKQKVPHSELPIRNNGIFFSDAFIASSYSIWLCNFNPTQLFDIILDGLQYYIFKMVIHHCIKNNIMPTTGDENTNEYISNAFNLITNEFNRLFYGEKPLLDNDNTYREEFIDQLLPFVRKLYLLYIIISRANPKQPQPPQLTMEKLTNIDYCLSCFKFKGLLDMVNIVCSKKNFENTLNQFLRKDKMTTVISAIPQVFCSFPPPLKYNSLPKWIDLPTRFVDFMKDHLFAGHCSKCGALLKLVCLMCGHCSCETSTCRIDLFFHRPSCCTQYPLAFFHAIDRPFAKSFKLEQGFLKSQTPTFISIYLDQNGHKIASPSIHAKLSNKKLSKLYKCWIDCSNRRKYFIEKK